ncbi:MAG TPA: hypothetical protein H9790_03985 [Candidatus Agathobaculum intestinipullorum]|nr:hypothetical protein [Candidatus Agathobaculum intestinipullorum]
MKKDRLSELAVGLSGLSYSEWKQLKMIVDATFRKKKSEMEQKIQIASLDELQQVSQSLFG